MFGVYLMTLVVPMAMKERPFIMFTVNMLSWACSVAVQWDYTAGFYSYGGFAIFYWVIPSLVVVLIASAAYASYYHDKIASDESSDQSRVITLKKNGLKLLRWIVCVLLAYIITNFGTFLGLLEGLA